MYLPLDGMHELYQRTPATRRMVILRRADHYHFMDDGEELHETARATALGKDMRADRRALLGRNRRASSCAASPWVTWMRC